MDNDHIIISNITNYQIIASKKKKRVLEPKPDLFVFSLFNLYKDKALEPVCMESKEFIDGNSKKSLNKLTRFLNFRNED